MKTVFPLLFLFLLAKRANSQDTLFVYGPGGPQAPVEECAKAFAQKFAVPVKVTAGPEAKWIEAAKQNADVVFGGAEYMLTQFAMQHPGLMDSTTRTELYKRRAGILVRPGNPKKIWSLKDLSKPGMRLLDVNGAGQMGLWEDLAGKQNLIASIQKNIRRSFANSALAIDAWKTDTSYDAWITYASWHYRLKDLTTLVRIPVSENLYRGTPVAIATISRQKAIAQKFIQYLQSKEAAAIFRKWGWE